MSGEGERLQKFLARAGVASRRASEAIISAGRVTVNGTVVQSLGTRIDPHSDAIKVDGRRVFAPAEGDHVYLAIHKPRGVVTTLSDPEGRPTVRDLLPPTGGRRVFPVGRLDFWSEGLLLFTDDGALAHALMHPARGVPKTYRCKVHGTPDRDALRRLRDGVSLDGRPARAVRASVVKPGSNAWVEVVVAEGRKHVVRRMLQAVGHKVLRLRRTAYGPVELGELPSGHARRLSRGEVERLSRSVAGRPSNTGRPRRNPLISR